MNIIRVCIYIRYVIIYITGDSNNIDVYMMCVCVCVCVCMRLQHACARFCVYVCDFHIS